MNRPPRQLTYTEGDVDQAPAVTVHVNPNASGAYAVRSLQAVMAKISPYDSTCARCGEKARADYMVRDELWTTTISSPDRHRLVHFTCFEALIGRRLVLGDLTDVPLNRTLRAVMARTAPPKGGPHGL